MDLDELEGAYADIDDYKYGKTQMLNEKLIYERSSVDAGARIIASLKIERDQREKDMDKAVQKKARDMDALYDDLERERKEYQKLLKETGSKQTIFPTDYRTPGYSPSPPPVKNSTPIGRTRGASPSPRTPRRQYSPEFEEEDPTRKSAYETPRKPAYDDDYYQMPTRKESYSAEPDREVYKSTRKASYSYSPEPARETYKSDRKRKASDSPEPYPSPKRKASYSPEPYNSKRAYSPEPLTPKRKKSYSPEPYETRKQSYSPEPARETYKSTRKASYSPEPARETYKSTRKEYTPSPKTPKSYSFDKDDYSPLTGTRAQDEQKSASPRGYDLDDDDLYEPSPPPTKEPVAVDEYAYDYPNYNQTRGGGYDDYQGQSGQRQQQPSQNW